ncbi:MAG: alpha/beta hydrolase [Pseudomonadota bacterium]
MTQSKRSAVVAIAAGAVLSVLCACATGKIVTPPEQSSTGPQRIAVWPGVAPGAEKLTQVEQETVAPWGDRVVRNVVKPSLEVYLPDPAIANGTAVVICPGGAFRFLSIDLEGEQIARWLNSKGIAAFILRYRVEETPASDLSFSIDILGILVPLLTGGGAIHEDMQRLGPPAIADAQQAVKLVRKRAKEWGISTRKIGVLGFSAGGVVATGVATDHDSASRPDFAGIIYSGPWNIAKVPDDTPPVFLAAAADDGLTAISTLPIYKTLQAAGVEAELHVYAEGGHGFALKQQETTSDQWAKAFTDWLEMKNMLKRSK